MSDIAIKVENLSKLYRIGMREQKHETFMGALASWATAPLSNYRRLRRLTHFDISSSGPRSPVTGQHSAVSGRRSAVSQDDLIWALKDVSFEVHRGEVVGIIGRNGAGKSTLLKILSRITEPTGGRAFINGRVASLLEVGTGFHGELTGRENIHLNGTILGMSRKEVDWKFKEIIAFCELEKFIDTPVKYYSSGMYVRLAFAVAAHLEPEILFVDEVLSVGDASFQKKCIGKMQNVAKEGRTVLFVSHQMSAVKSLCSRVIRIDQGLVVQDGQPATVIANYLESASTQIVPERVWDQEGTRPGNSQFHLTAVRVLGAEGIIKKVFDSSRPITMEMEFILRQIDPALFVGFVLINQNGIVLLQSCHNHTEESDWPSLRIGANRLQCEIPPNILNNGIYYVRPRIGLNFANYIIFNEVEISFEVRIDHCKSPFWNASADVAFPGVIAPFFHWTALSPYLENIHEAS